MIRADAPPPGLGQEDRVVLFDGVCRLCAAWTRFLIRFDAQRRFRLATVQSDAGAAILRHFGLPTEDFDTMVVVEGSRAYLRSAAFFRVMARLPLPFPLVCVLWLVPSPLRDAIYDHIADHRYRWFGRLEFCAVPEAAHVERFLGPASPSTSDPPIDALR